MKNTKILLMALVLGIFTISSAVKADINRDNLKKVDNQDEIQRRATGEYDLQQNTVSNIQFYTTNYGIFGLDVARLIGGGFWPRGSRNQYIFAGGVWFAAMKTRPGAADPDDKQPYVTISYNPNSGRSWLVPGRIREDGPCGSAPLQMLVDPGQESVEKYRTYFSTDFRVNSGEPLDPEDGPNWPIWDASDDIEDTLKNNRYFGHYIDEEDDRDFDTYEKGPAFISGEDIFATYKDTDLSRYEGGAQARELYGYPLMLQYEQMIYSWGFGDYRDFIFLKYTITNYSDDTLTGCWLAPVSDTDIARAPNTAFGAGNDRARFYEEEDSLNLAVQWTDGDRGEGGFGFGYLGFDFLESPAVVQPRDSTYFVQNQDGTIDTVTVKVFDEDTGFIRKDKKVYSNDEQLGLVTFVNWNIENDPSSDDQRYGFMSERIKDGDTGPGDKRFMMATGPFNMRPCDTVRVVVGLMIAPTAKGGDADGTTDDLQALVTLNKFAQQVYDNNFRAPQPPNRGVFTDWEALNNGVRIMWDSTSEVSLDEEEQGMDFLGYRLYRARRTDLEEYADYSSTSQRVGPFGWKQIAQWSMLPPFQKSQYQPEAPNDNVAQESMPFIDSIRIIGPYYNDQNGIDSMSIRIMRIPRGVSVTPFEQTLNGYHVPVVTNIDTSGSIFSINGGVVTQTKDRWGSYLWSIFESDPEAAFVEEYGVMQNYYYPTPQVNQEFINQNRFQDQDVRVIPSSSLNIFDEVMVGAARLNRALVKFNPFFWERKTIEIARADYEYVFEEFPDGLVGPFEWDTVTVIKPDPNNPDEPDTSEVASKVLFRIDTIYHENTLNLVELEDGFTYTCDISLPKPVNEMMRDSVHVKAMLDSLYKYVLENKVTFEFPEYEDSQGVKQNVILPTMRELTNNRTFVDYGDDNGDGVIDYNEDITLTEKLINNVDYHYKLLAFDEGDYRQPTESKINDGSDGLPNVVTTRPVASEVGNVSTIRVIEVDSSKIGGLYNFNFFAVDQERVNQLYSGDTLELTINPEFNLLSVPLDDEFENFEEVGFYAANLTLENLTKRDTLFETVFLYEPSLCNFAFRDLISENGASRVFGEEAVPDTVRGDTITFGVYDSEETIFHAGTFTTGEFNDSRFCYANGFNQEARNTLGFSFEFQMEDIGGIIRPASIEAMPGVTAVTPLKIPTGSENLKNSEINIKTQQTIIDFNNFSIETEGFNAGAGDYLLTFEPGGTETYEFAWGVDKENVGTFNVEYLNVKLENLTEHIINDERGQERSVNYERNMEHLSIPPKIIPKVLSESYSVDFYGDGNKYYPDPRNLELIEGRDASDIIGKWNIAAYGFANGRGQNIVVRIPRQIVAGTDGVLNNPDIDNTFTGVQGRYLKSATANIDGEEVTIDFMHLITIGGQRFGLDYANKGYAFSNGIKFWDAEPTNEYVYGEDFKVGDQLMLRTSGGVKGLPLPGAKIKAVVRENIPQNREYTESMLDDIRVVPNPYYVSHQSQSSPYDSKIYFTKLPPGARIDIYTLAGDLIRTLRNEDNAIAGNNSEMSVEVFDLLSSNNQRVSSQSLVAVITAPNGETTVKNFSVVVGGFRLIENN